MNDCLNIPERIIVGFANRGDCPSGRLAYVTYYRGKKIAKETSWEGWRNKSIEPEEFENIPTSGFILNKKVGGTRYGWNQRQTYCRISDPRGFEFEISVENLLFILDYCDCMSGKGLEGKFVYSWDGADLVLLPVTSIDYTSTLATKEKVAASKIRKEGDLVIGKKYRVTKTEELYYLGKLIWTLSDGVKLEFVEYPTFLDTTTNLVSGLTPGAIKRIMYQVDTEKDLTDLEVNDAIRRFRTAHFGKQAFPSQIRTVSPNQAALDLWDKIKNKDVTGKDHSDIVFARQINPTKIELIFGLTKEHSPIIGKPSLKFYRVNKFNTELDKTGSITTSRHDFGTVEMSIDELSKYSIISDGGRYFSDFIEVFIGDSWYNTADYYYSSYPGGKI